MYNEKVAGILNGLIETCRDGQEGFKEAAENLKSQDLKKLFREEGQQRAQFVIDLQQQVRDLGGNPENSGSTAGALHRAWIGIKGSLIGRDDKTILSEAERGEDSAVSAYEDALRSELPVNTRTLVERQFHQVKATHDRIKLLRDAEYVATSAR